MIELWLLRSWNCQNRESQRACYCKVTMWFRYVSFINISRYSTLFVPTSSYWLSSPPRPGPVKDLAELTDKVWSKSNGLPQAEEARGNLLVERNSCSWITVFHTELGLDCVHQRYYFHSCSLGWGKRSIQFLHWSWKVLRGGGMVLIPSIVLSCMVNMRSSVQVWVSSELPEILHTDTQVA